MRSIVSALMRSVAAVMVIGTATAHAAEIRLIASAAVKPGVVELIRAFEESSGHKVTPIWAGTEAIAKRIKDGELVDIVLIAARNIDELVSEGRLVAGSRADVAKSGIGIAAKSIAYSSGPSGFYLAELFKKMGIAEQIKGKVKQTPSGVQVGEVVARGDADLGFQQISELLHVEGIEYLGPLPADIQHITMFSAGLHSAAAAPDAAKALIKFLVAPEAGPTIRKSGMEPGAGAAD
jgi:molybdate transport system substrate-binding protein